MQVSAHGELNMTFQTDQQTRKTEKIKIMFIVRIQQVTRMCPQFFRKSFQTSYWHISGNTRGLRHLIKLFFFWAPEILLFREILLFLWFRFWLWWWRRLALGWRRRLLPWWRRLLPNNFYFRFRRGRVSLWFWLTWSFWFHAVLRGRVSLDNFDLRGVLLLLWFRRILTRWAGVRILLGWPIPASATSLPILPVAIISWG